MFVVIEEENFVKGGIVYDLLKGEFATLEEAINEAETIYNHTLESERNPLFVADADSYYSGDYDYLFSIGFKFRIQEETGFTYDDVYNTIDSAAQVIQTYLEDDADERNIGYYILNDLYEIVDMYNC